MYYLLQSLNLLKSFKSLAFRLMDFRVRIISLVGAPYREGNTYYIAIKDIKKLMQIKVSSNSSRIILRAPKFYGNYSYSRWLSYYRSIQLASSYALTTYRSFLLSLLLELSIDPALQALHSLKSKPRQPQNYQIHSQCREVLAGRSKQAPVQIDYCLRVSPP